MPFTALLNSNNYFRKTDCLLDGLGYKYTKKNKGKGRNRWPEYWRCPNRKMAVFVKELGEITTKSCKAYVRRTQDGKFCLSTNTHNHERTEDLESKVKIAKLVKSKAKKRKFDSAKEIVEDVLLKQFEKETKTFPEINFENLARIANREREKSRPSHPTDLFFEVDENHVPPNFFQRRSFGTSWQKAGTAFNLCHRLTTRTSAESEEMVRRWNI